MGDEENEFECEFVWEPDPEREGAGMGVGVGAGAGATLLRGCSCEADRWRSMRLRRWRLGEKERRAAWCDEAARLCSGCSAPALEEGGWRSLRELFDPLWLLLVLESPHRAAGARPCSS